MLMVTPVTPVTPMTPLLKPKSRETFILAMLTLLIHNASSTSFYHGTLTMYGYIQLQI